MACQATGSKYPGGYANTVRPTAQMNKGWHLQAVPCTLSLAPHIATPPPQLFLRGLHGHGRTLPPSPTPTSDAWPGGWAPRATPRLRASLQRGELCCVDEVFFPRLVEKLGLNGGNRYLWFRSPPLCAYFQCRQDFWPRMMPLKRRL